MIPRALASEDGLCSGGVEGGARLFGMVLPRTKYVYRYSTAGTELIHGE